MNARDAGADAGARARMRGGRWLATAVVLAIVAGAAGFVAGHFVVSPRQLAAQSAPPTPTLVTAEVVRQRLANTVVARGVVTPVRQVNLGYGALLRDGSTTEPGGDGVLTAVFVTVGDPVKAGAVVAEISGRPMILLPGARPMYRDIRPGDTGPDVRQLNAALKSLGHLRGAAGDTFGTAAQRALRSLYDMAGYDPATTTGDTGGGAEPAPTALNGEAASPPQTGVYAPQREIVFVPDLPAFVSGVSGGVGYAAPEVVLRLTSSALEVVSTLPANQAAILSVGDPVELDLPDGSAAVGRVDRLGGEHDGNRPVVVSVPAGLDFALSGQDVKATFTAAETDDEVLAVPPGAVSSDAAGRLWVFEVGERDRLTKVEVTTGVAGDGLVEITPVTASLAPGRNVLIGR